MGRRNGSRSRSRGNSRQPRNTQSQHSNASVISLENRRNNNQNTKKKNYKKASPWAVKTIADEIFGGTYWCVGDNE